MVIRANRWISIVAVVVLASSGLTGVQAFVTQPKGSALCFTRNTSSELGPRSRRRRNNLANNDAHSFDEDSDATLTGPQHIAHSRPATNSWKAFVTGAVLVSAVLCFPPQAQAGFGPSGGATTTPAPGVGNFNVVDLSSKKLEQVIGTSLDESRLNELQSQLEALIETISSRLGSMSEEEDEQPRQPLIDLSKTEPAQQENRAADKERLSKARKFRSQIMQREKLLDKLEAQPWWFNYFAAFCGSVASTLVMHPVDTIKTRLQVLSSNETDPVMEGKRFKNLYEGLSGNILKEGPPSALYLGVYETVKSNLMHGKLAGIWASIWSVTSTASSPSVTMVATNPTYLLSIYLVAGAAGELVGSVIRAPAEAVKSTVQTRVAPSFSEAFKIVLGQPEGRQNVLRAWSASICRDVPFGAIQLALFETTKAFILNNPDIDFDSSTLTSEAIIGAFAGACGAFLTTPTDVITTRIIFQSSGGDDEESPPLGVIDMGRLIYDEGGLEAFFTGWQARVAYWAPAISIFLTCYCSVRQAGVKLDLFGGA